MAVWVFSPFAALVWAHTASKRWPELSRKTLHGVMLFVALASLAIYGADAVWSRKAQPAFFYVLVPPVSWLLSAIVVAIAALISRKRPHRDKSSSSEKRMHTKILKRSGLVLIVVGALDIAYMIWCISKGVSYSSSFNIFALVGGILLFRGGLKTARWVATLSTFMLAGCGVAILVVPFMYPLGYWIAVFRFGVGVGISLLVSAVLLGLLYWLRQQMMDPSVREAQLAAGLLPPKTKSAIAAGIILPIALMALLSIMFRGDTAREAMRRAEQQLGGNYHYVVTNMQMSSNMTDKIVVAIVSAYSDTELKSIQVRWKE